MDADEASSLTTSNQLEDGSSRIQWNNTARRKNTEEYHSCKKHYSQGRFQGTSYTIKICLN
jgi:hypothetical protein